MISPNSISQIRYFNLLTFKSFQNILVKTVICFQFLLFATSNLNALSVTANPSSLSCGSTSVTFTFDCPFTGSVLFSSPSGISFPGLNLVGSAYIETVTNGSITFNLAVATSSPSNTSINFVVISSNMSSCASNSSNATANFTTTCTPPPNDQCANAIILSLATNSCAVSNYTTINSSTTTTPPSSCGSFPTSIISTYHDLWYTFTANNSLVNLEISSNPGILGLVALYNNCPSNGGSSVLCSIETNTSSVQFSGLTIGSDYFIQILFNPAASGMDQELCLHSATPQPPCLNSIVVSDIGPNSPNTSYQVGTTISTNGATTVTNLEVVYDAAQSISLNPGFQAQLGSGFLATINGCAPFTSLPLEVENSRTYVPSESNQISTVREGNTNKDGLKIAPNPFSNNTNFLIHLENTTSISINIFDLNGRLIENTAANKLIQKGRHTFSFASKNLDSGLYYVVLQTNTERITKKMVIRK